MTDETPTPGNAPGLPYEAYPKPAPWVQSPEDYIGAIRALADMLRVTDPGRPPDLETVPEVGRALDWLAASLAHDLAKKGAL